MRISIIGGGTVADDARETAAQTGRVVARRGHTVVCGGLGGVMEAACRGAKAAGGDTIGILPTDRRADANDYVDTPIATGLGHGRNALVVMNGDAAVAIDGAGGTLSEIGFSLVFDRPIAGLGTHEVRGVEACETPAEAVEYVESAVDG
ncbi:TIGR00725 family protein [Halogeometricum sp. CBA1124]|uniref:TIGR00725 family protein n=1 Tax=Halogeometricum sp. CBA1124 TaxID=2668071 RepID=UPI001428DAC3|nr:TIGR00725 family protein [Halogeometricum sp. CBA1124]MUV57690.1 TIGR00725 family protein [Halogeometricum sp. CBA1124]